MDIDDISNGKYNQYLIDAIILFRCYKETHRDIQVTGIIGLMDKR